ncbi:MAG: hypothetical protein DLM71_04405 [Chloroflexi bacterium]|nr:MAG: hypothetical protein DLM71_04405 [Chloroflexota bacterium]
MGGLRGGVRPMMRSAVRALAGAGLLLLLGAGSALAADDYTLPFSNPDVQLSYGIDRDPTRCRQLDWTGQVWNDCASHPGRAYDNHTGIDYPMGLQSAVVAARDGTVVGLFEGYGTEEFGSAGNYVRVRHADGRDSLYYHLAQGGVLVGINQKVYAGQQIARSGCSGICYGAHLHFELDRLVGSVWQPSDPMAERRWTTWPGRVPYLASVVRESNSGTEVIRRYQTVTHWVEFRNLGGRAWRPDISLGRLLLVTYDPPLHASAFAAADWPSSTVATPVDAGPIGPNGIGRYTFGLRGGPPPGTYRESFNLLANSVAWFDHGRIGNYYVPIVISNFSP